MDVVVTGIGPLLPGCGDRRALWAHLRDAAPQLVFEAAPGAADERWPVGRIHGFDPARWLDRFPRRYYERYHREQQVYLASLLIALTDAGIEIASVSSERTGLFDGTSRGNFDYWYERVRDEQRCRAGELYTRRELLIGTPGQSVSLAAGLLGIRGPAYTFNATCCSGAVAIAHACRELATGSLDLAIASGHDCALQGPLFHMYRDAGLLSAERDDPRRAIRPFVDHSRNAFGEGSVALVLETRKHAERRGATPLAAIGGLAYGNNGGHPLDVDREGGRAASLIADVLARAGVDRQSVGFVVGHGNGVEQSDRSELAYMQRVFGDRTDVPLLSAKPIYGHLLGGSSALNVAAAALMLHHAWVVPTANVPVGRSPIDHVTTGRPCHATAGLAVSYGIGGHNAVTLLRRAEVAS